MPLCYWVLTQSPGQYHLGPWTRGCHWSYSEAWCLEKDLGVRREGKRRRMTSRNDFVAVSVAARLDMAMLERSH